MQRLRADVAIVGAGPGGLTAAHALRAAAPDLKVVVFEKSPACIQTTRRGAGLGLDINGQRSLQAISPGLHRSMLDMASFLESNKVLRPDGSEVVDVPQVTGIREKYAKQGYKTPCLFGWSDMQRLLASALPPSEVPIYTGLEFDRYELAGGADEESCSSLTAFFTPTNSSSSSTQAAAGGGGGARGPVAVEAGLLVASDGYFSRVRKQCLADGPPQWDSSLLWRARLPRKDAAAAGVDLVNSSLFMQDVGRFLFTFPISSGDLVWTAGCHDDKLTEMGLDLAELQRSLAGGSLTSRAAAAVASSAAAASSSAAASSEFDYSSLATHGYCAQEVAAGRAALGRCLQAMAGVSDSVLELIRVTPPSSVVEHGVYIRPVSSVSPASFGRGRVVIMGDAAHPVRPTGQGYNQAVEDAHALGCALAGSSSGMSNSSSSGGVRPAINLGRLDRGFRAVRARRIKPIVAFSTETGRAAYRVLQEMASEEEAARLSMGTGTDEMTNEAYDSYVYNIEFEPLSPDMMSRSRAVVRWA